MKLKFISNQKLKSNSEKKVFECLQYFNRTFGIKLLKNKAEIDKNLFTDGIIYFAIIFL